MTKNTLSQNNSPKSEARAAAINELLAKGYTDEDGQPRPIHNREHCEFLARSGTIELPE